MHSFLFLIPLLCFSPIHAAFDHPRRLWRSDVGQVAATTLEARADGAPLRNVYAVADIAVRPTVISPRTGSPLLYGHAFLHVEGTPQDGAIRVEHVQPHQNLIGMRMLDYTVQNNDKETLPPKMTKSTVRKTWLVGQTRLTNAEFADPVTGKGLIVDVWSKNPLWVQGSNCCNQFVQNLVKALGLTNARQFNVYVGKAKEYASLKLFPMTREDLPLYIDTVTDWGKSGGNTQIEFDTTDLKNPKLLAPAVPVDESEYVADTSVAGDDGLKMPLERPGSVAPPPPSPFDKVDLSSIEASSGQAATGNDNPSGESQPETDKSSSTIDVTGDKPQAVTSLRIGGVASDLTVVLGETAKAAGIAGVAAAPLFVILDFVNGNPVGGAFGAVGLFLTELAVVAIDGPIGWVVGGLAALFSILPSFFSKPAAQLPSIKNTTQILQYAMFGDINHTGNEKCREQNPNCTALYGPGVLGAALKWNNFDPIAFLLQNNNGYAMSLPEIAAAFYITDSSIPGDGANKIATISCQHKRPFCGRFNCPGPDTTTCSQPTFTLNRALITLPILNQTADKIFDRIIPKPHGDCKLINDMSENHYADYDITVTGSPAAIACGLTASIQTAPMPPAQNTTTSPAHNITTPPAQNSTRTPLQNSIIPPLQNVSTSASSNSNSSYFRNTTSPVTLINDPNAYNGRPAASHSLGNLSTDGSIHEVAAPYPTGFPPNPLNASNAVCLSGSAGNMCFPNGTYAIQTGIFGFDSSKVDSLTLPPSGASLSFTVPAKGKPHQALSLKTWTYTTAQSSSSRDFRTNFAAIAATAFGPRTFDVSVPGGPPVACLYSDKQFEGDMMCYGAGSGNVSASAVNVAQSLRLHGGANVWIYGKYYGDDGGQEIGADTADLSEIPFGVDGNFGKMIKALWVTSP